MATNLPAWLDGLGPQDFLLDGGRCTPAQWALLDWTRAYVDMGPSPAGNLGPYWHVPYQHDGEELSARLYPTVLRSKWLGLIRQAIAESTGNGRKRSRKKSALLEATDAR